MSGELEQIEELKEKCFVMMPISDALGYPKNHFTKVYENIFRPAIISAGFEPYRVDENAICDSIINKIFDAIQNSPMCLCDLSSRNPNVLYELGLRQAYNKPVVLVQDYKTEKIFDVGGISTVYYRSERLYDEVIEDTEKIKEAIIATKNGGQDYNSIIRLVKARTASIDDVKMPEEERIEIMLMAIQNDINMLKKAIPNTESFIPSARVPYSNSLKEYELSNYVDKLNDNGLEDLLSMTLSAVENKDYVSMGRYKKKLEKALYNCRNNKIDYASPTITSILQLVDNELKNNI